MKNYPIQNRAAFVSMVTVGLFLVLWGFFGPKVQVLFEGMSIAPYVMIVVALISFIISMIELGIKRWTGLSKLKSFNNQQLLTFAIACLVVISSVFVTIFPGFEPLTFFNQGVFVVQGGTLILEAVR